MKKLSHHQITRAKNIAVRCRNLERIAANHRDNRRRHRLSSLFKRRTLRTSVLKIKAPKIFTISLGHERDQVFTFLSDIHFALKEDRSVRIDFSEIELLHPCGTLLFVAVIDRLLTSNPGKITCNYPKNEIVEQLFQHIGLLKSMGLAPRKTITADNVKHWHYVTGHSADTSGFRDLMQTYQHTLDTPIRMGLYDSMTEAVTNCIHHAYDDENHLLNAQSEKKWWMFAEHRNDKLTVVICDLGIGIAGSLKQKPEFSDIMRKWISYRRVDKRLLGSAVGSSRTRTRLPHRGKGLPEMLEFVRGSTNGGLLIHCNHAGFGFDAANHIEALTFFPQPLYGTLVQWGLPLDVEI